VSSQERSGWRDLGLNNRHRLWGVNVPATDIDLFLEYDGAVPRGIVEYKHERAETQHSTHPNNKALIRLGNCAEIPVLAVRYTGEYDAFTVTPLNDFAKTHVASRHTYNEDEYVKLLYKIRDREQTLREYMRFIEKTRKDVAS